MSNIQGQRESVGIYLIFMWYFWLKIMCESMPLVLFDCFGTGLPQLVNIKTLFCLYEGKKSGRKVLLI